MGQHWECRYCDRPAGYMGIPITVGDEQICACGAEWVDAKILVHTTQEEDDNIIQELNNLRSDPWLNDYQYEDEDCDDCDELEAAYEKVN